MAKTSKSEGPMENYAEWAERYKKAEDALIALVEWGTLTQIESAKLNLRKIAEGHSEYVREYRRRKYGYQA